MKLTERLRGTSLTPESQDHLSMDVLRFAAACGVALFHFRHEISDPAVREAVNAHTQHFHLLVELFFAISGYSIATVYADRLGTPKQYLTFLRRRLARTGPIHYATLLAFLALWAAWAAFDLRPDYPDRYRLDCVAPNALMLQAFGTCPTITFNYVTWTLSAEWAFYVIAPLLIAVAVRWPLAILAATAVSLAALGAAFSPSESWLRLLTTGALRAVPSILFGVTLFAYGQYLPRLPAGGLLVWVAAGAFLVLPIVFPTAPAYLWLTLVYLLCALSAAADKHRQVPQWAAATAGLGQLTVGIYFLHPLVLAIAFYTVGEVAMGLKGWQSDVWLAVCFPVTIAVAWASLRFFERPARAWIGGRRQGALKAPPPQGATPQTTV